MLVSRYRQHKQQLPPKKLDEWLDHLAGWAEIDNLCQGYVMGEEMLSRWSEWQLFLKDLNKSPNINKQRASLVLLCKPLGTSPDLRLMKLALRNVGYLKQYQEVLITKAISWVLRQMVKYHSEALQVYLDTQASSLPKIALREARRKLETGRK
jgi:3-methyladenine DNA glycosylase AlkD